jgi:branched-chain amino acid aminotransferase
VCFLDAVERRWVEELGGMNLYFVHADGRLVTPELTGTILEGVTRLAILTLAKEQCLDVEERGSASTSGAKESRPAGSPRCSRAAPPRDHTSRPPGVGGRRSRLRVGQPDGDQPGPVTMRLRRLWWTSSTAGPTTPTGWMRRLA